MSEVLIPLDFIQEQGRMPLNRGPKALQEKGVPYYGLTRKGFIVAMALSKTVNVRAVLGACFIGMTEEEKEIKNIMIVLYKTSPKLVRHLFEKYVRAYCEGKFDSLLPLNIAKFGANDEFMAILKEFLTNLPKINKDDNIKIHSLIHQLSNQTIH